MALFKKSSTSINELIAVRLLVLLIMIMVMVTTSPSFQGGTTAIYLHCIFFPDKLANQFFIWLTDLRYITVHGKGDDGRQQRSE
jgi:hypothetical protein